jgi:hypothetical protein
MARVRCKECGKKVNAKVTLCPHCKNPVVASAATPATILLAMAGVIVVIFVLMLLASR